MPILAFVSALLLRIKWILLCKMLRPKKELCKCVSIKSVWFFLSQVFCSTQTIENVICKKWALLAAITRKVDVQWSQIGDIMVYMLHNGGFFSAVTRLRGDSSTGNVMGSGSPVPAAEQSTEHRPGSTQRCQARSPQRGTGSYRMHISREKPFSGTWVILGRHSEGHFGRESEDHLPW